MRERRDEVKTMKTLKKKREGLPEEDKGSRPDEETKVKATRTIPT